MNRSELQEDAAIRQAKEFANSRAGQELLAYLQQTQGKTLQNAMDQAAAGNMSEVKKTLSSLLSSPEVRAMLEKQGK